MSSDKQENRCIVICGPTASGKSALAMKLANELNGEIINADSMQVYNELKVLTSRPSTNDTKNIPHHLFGIRKMVEPFSVNIWIKLVKKSISQIIDRGRIPIACGGTGMYIHYLSKRLSKIPEIPNTVRLQAREKLKVLGNENFSKELIKLDPLLGNKIPIGDSQRLTRAWEVMKATGQSLATWNMEPDQPTGLSLYHVLLIPDREILYRICDQRFLGFMDQGAVAEAETIKNMNLDPSLPAMKALGLSQIIKYLDGEMYLDDAIKHAQQKTRNYAKRQMTWFRNQLEPNFLYTKPYDGSIDQDLIIEVSKFLNKS
jgi:tRNA dimethylallyltransferase